MDRGVVIPSIGRSPRPRGLRHGAPRPFPAGTAKLDHLAPQRRGRFSLPEDVMNRIGRTLGVLIVGLMVTIAFTSSPWAQSPSWPQRPVKFLVSLGAGSGADIGARLLAERLTTRWNQPVVVENRPGGDAVVAINAFIGARDDHVLLYTPTSSFTAHPYQL